MVNVVGDGSGYTPGLVDTVPGDTEQADGSLNEDPDDGNESVGVDTRRGDSYNGGFWGGGNEDDPTGGNDFDFSDGSASCINGLVWSESQGKCVTPSQAQNGQSGGVPWVYVAAGVVGLALAFGGGR